MKSITFICMLAVANVFATTKVWQGGEGDYSNDAFWNNNSVPVAGDDVVISNGVVTVTSTDSFSDLQSIALGEGGTIVCAEPVETTASVIFSSTNATMEVTSEELAFHGFGSGTGFIKEGTGNVRFTGQNSAFSATVPGLREGQLSGSFDLSSPNTGTRVSTLLEKANTAWSTENTTYVYTGNIYLDGTEYSFAENINDNIYLSIAGNTVLSNMSYTVITTGTIKLSAGWYPIEIRVGNGIGSGGSGNVYSTGGGIAWKKEDSLSWNILRDIGGGSFLQTQAKLAANFSSGITINDGTVVVDPETYAGTVNSTDINNLGAVFIDNECSLIFSNTLCNVTALNGNITSSVTVAGSCLSVSNETECTYLGTTAGTGTLAKNGSGQLNWQPLSATHYAHTATVVNDGYLSLGNPLTYLDYNFRDITVNAPGIINTPGNGNCVFYNLWGDGIVTNSFGGNAHQLRITKGPCEFSGVICGNNRYYSQGEVYLTGTNSTFTYSAFGIHSIGGPGITGVKKIGMIGEPSSIGKATQVDIRENGGTFLYLGTGETTDKTFVLYPSANRAVLDAGDNGGVIFDGNWSSSRTVLNRVALTGSNVVPCEFNGAYSETSYYSTYLAKEGAGTWRLNHNSGRANRGVVDVREGTLQFESIAEAGSVCSLGYSDRLFEDVLTSDTNGHAVAYAFSLGTDTTTGTLEYVGTEDSSCSTRKLVLQGDGCLKSDCGSLSFAGGVESLTAGAKTLYLDGSGTNGLGCVADGAGTVGITKEGSGTWMMTTTNNFSGPLSVNSGRLILDKRGYSYYRFSLLERNNGAYVGDSNIELTEFALYSAEGTRRNLDLVKIDDDSVASLEPGEYCKMDNYFDSYSATRTSLSLFDGNASSQWTVNSSGWLPNIPISLVMRLAEGTPSITGYDLQYWNSVSNRYLSGWSVEGSRDGVSWDMLDTKMDYDPIPPAVVGSGKWWYSTGTTSPTNSFPISDGQLAEAQLQGDVPVNVAAGAELTCLGGAEPLSLLSVDYDAGAGTMNGISLAANGRIDLSATSSPGANFTLPLTVTGLSNPEELSSWKIYINDELLTGVVLHWNESTGAISVNAVGTIIIVR